MSWKERINVQFKITTGDDKDYFPLLSQENTASLDMMAGSFEFSLVDGSLVKRKSSDGITYPLVFSFTGDDHLDLSDAFIESARNRKPWVMEHPKYGIKNVQPLTIKRSDSNLNATTFTVSVKETIVRNYPNAIRSKEDSIKSLADDATLTAASSFGLAIKEVTTEDKLVVSDSIDRTYEQYKQFSTTAEDATELENAYNQALTAVDDLANGFDQVQAFVAIPSTYSSSVAVRITQLRRAYDEAKKDVSNFNLKEYFQAIAATVIAAICDTSINPNEGDYSRRKDIDTITRQIDDIYSDYIDTLGEISDENLSLTDAFNPDPNTVGATEKVVNESVANLNEVIFGALVENIYQVPYDTNLILLTHLLLGRVTDDNVKELMAINDFTRDQIIQVKKGVEVTYFT